MDSEHADADRSGVFLVSKSSSPARLAGAIDSRLHGGSPVTMRAVGPFAVNQAIKAAALADGCARLAGGQLHLRVAMVEVPVADRVMVAVEIEVLTVPMSRIDGAE